MTPPQRTADDWRYAALYLTALALHFQGPGEPTCAVISCSIDEDNILERLLAEYWDAKDRFAALVNCERRVSNDATYVWKEDSYATTRPQMLAPTLTVESSYKQPHTSWCPTAHCAVHWTCL